MNKGHPQVRSLKKKKESPIYTNPAQAVKLNILK